MNGQAGKGDAYRPVDPKKWSENYDRIFRKNKKATNGQSKPKPKSK